MKKTLIWAAMVVAIAAVAFLLLGGRKRAEAKYRTAVVDKGNVTQTVAATGTLSAVTTVKVGSVVSGNVAALHADFNKQVKKGDLLEELAPVAFSEKVEPAAGAHLDQAQANYASAKAAVGMEQAALAQAQTDLRNSRIVAPIDGVVV